jgi:ornithine--oxo-acid transaminase
MAQFAPGDHGSTFGGNPLAAAVGTAALQLLEAGPFCANAAMQGPYLVAQLHRLRHPAIVDIRGKGLFVGVEIDPAFASARHVCDALVGRGILTKDTHGTVVRLAPALTIERAEIDLAVEAIGRTLHAIGEAQAVPA